MDTTDVIVIGGGVIGLACAWRAATAGVRVTVIDEAPGRGASWAAAGMLAPVTEVHYGEEPLLALTLAANRRWPSFAAELEAETGHDIGYRTCGTLAVARDRDDLAALAALADYQLRLGLDVERLSSRACRSLEPGLAAGVRGGLLVAGDHQVDNRALVVALREACARGGVTMVRERVEALRSGSGRVTGVRLAGGQERAAGAVVLAAGAWSARIQGLPPQALPVRPVKGQLLHLRGAPGALAGRTIRGLDVYVVPRTDGRVVVGATVEEQGFDVTVTAGAVRDLLHAAWELLPQVAELALVETVAGLRPATPDNAPLLGPVADLAGLVAATGHYRNGVLLAPVTADGIAELLRDGALPAALAPFSPDRFAATDALASATAGPPRW